MDRTKSPCGYNGKGPFLLIKKSILACCPALIPRWPHELHIQPFRIFTCHYVSHMIQLLRDRNSSNRRIFQVVQELAGIGKHGHALIPVSVACHLATPGMLNLSAKEFRNCGSITAQATGSILCSTDKRWWFCWLAAISARRTATSGRRWS